MDRQLLKFPFKSDRTPDWMCPTCKKSPLRIKKGTFVKEERRDSREHSYDGWEPESIEYVYSCFLVCSNDQCGEVVASGGTGSVDWEVGEDEHGEQVQVYNDYFRPRYFHPPLSIFPIPAECPESVSEPLQESFALFFVAPNAASNNVRIALEALLTELKVPRYKLASGKRRFITLHQRISQLPISFQHLRDLILAIKWLGNAGSHDGAEITLDDVMDSYKLMEHILSDVYENKLKELHRLAKKVNKKKGPAK